MLAAVLLAGVWLDVPYVAQQSKAGCGPAVVEMIARYWKRPVDTAALERELGAPARASSLVSWFEGHGFRAFAFQAGRGDLRQNLEKGRPLIVCLRGSPLHFVVLAGLDPERKVVLVNDPARRKLLPLDEAEFARVWYRHWALLAVPK